MSRVTADLECLQVYQTRCDNQFACSPYRVYRDHADFRTSAQVFVFPLCVLCSILLKMKLAGVCMVRQGFTQPAVFTDLAIADQNALPPHNCSRLHIFDSLTFLYSRNTARPRRATLSETDVPVNATCSWLPHHFVDSASKLPYCRSFWNDAAMEQWMARADV